MKLCGRCGRTLSSASFHKRAASKDGLSACCKLCQQIYDSERLHLSHRVAARKAYAQTENGKRLTRLGQKEWIFKNAKKRAAHIIADNAIRTGRLKKQPCEVCGATKVHAHHDDYSKPMEVRWLCPTHHFEHHVKEREKARQLAKAA